MSEPSRSRSADRARSTFWVVYREGLGFRAYRWQMTSTSEYRAGHESFGGRELVDVRRQVRAWFRDLGAYAEVIGRSPRDAANIVETWAVDVPADIRAIGAA